MPGKAVVWGRGEGAGVVWMQAALEGGVTIEQEAGGH